MFWSMLCLCGGVSLQTSSYHRACLLGVVVCCDLAASSLYGFIRHFVAFVVVEVFFHVCPPFTVSAVVYFECEVPVVSVSTVCDSVVVSQDFFDCEVDEMWCVCFGPDAVNIDG